eukprot:3627339-Prymnesium_polylepis.1
MLERSPDGRMSVPEMRTALCDQLPAMSNVLSANVKRWVLSKGFAYLSSDAGGFVALQPAAPAQPLAPTDME